MAELLSNAAFSSLGGDPRDTQPSLFYSLPTSKQVPINY